MAAPKRHHVSSAQALALDAVADPHRREILALLRSGPRPVHEIAEQLPISRPAVSRHLRLLKNAGLVGDEAIGTARHYHLRAEGAEAARAYFEQLWSDAMHRFTVAAENTTDRQNRRRS